MACPKKFSMYGQPREDVKCTSGTCQAFKCTFLLGRPAQQRTNVANDADSIVARKEMIDVRLTLMCVRDVVSDTTVQ